MAKAAGITAIQALSAASTAFGVVQSVQQSRAQSSAASAARQQAAYNAAMQKRQAQQILQNQQFTETQKRKQNAARVSSQLAQIGKSGVELSGTPMGFVSRSIAEQELEILNDRYNSEIQAYNVESGAALTEYQGETVAQEREAAASDALGQAGRSLIGGASDLATLRKKDKLR